MSSKDASSGRYSAMMECMLPGELDMLAVDDWICRAQIDIVELFVGVGSKAVLPKKNRLFTDADFSPHHLLNNGSISVSGTKSNVLIVAGLTISYQLEPRSCTLEHNSRAILLYVISKVFAL